MSTSSFFDIALANSAENYYVSWLGSKTVRKEVMGNQVQSTLGFATMGIVAANLGIATAASLTDLCHYIIATLGITTFNFVTSVAK